MDNLIYVCLITIVLMQLPGSGEAYSAGRKRNGYLENVVDKLEDENKDIYETLYKRFIHQDRETSQLEKKAREEDGEEIEEMLDSFIAAEDLDGIDGYLNRKNKRGWWWCPWCQTSKVINLIADLLNCKCNTGTPLICKCPDGTILTDNGR